MRFKIREPGENTKAESGISLSLRRCKPELVGSASIASPAFLPARRGLPETVMSR